MSKYSQRDNESNKDFNKRTRVSLTPFENQRGTNLPADNLIIIKRCRDSKTIRVVNPDVRKDMTK